ncbi:Nucleoside-diphosphate-sugar epimerase [Actinopolymorpha cephalotaxi]|uniref:Nucleoside-diphosphate-sugar epimerase n=1 Tax=Actinopolymorpha cephalotaxi TaxID=504797 RepID=A0A1I2ZKB7_9ACTN|nr:SDR family oxidoreductase [Actinopolymorpha cephalotaxi]NYH82042.1 nucleoside-diphosphate-sugar epimerase [Actinopolymorpha cephalotaxi]SFH38174.1 Nucleoside-diphosphate-sugar epimerase [Actinopolymorpha cephalotaxi]
MTSLKVLFIGGTGIISSACGARAVESGVDLTILNRGSTSIRPVPDGAEVVQGDIRDPESARAALGDREFDVVVDFVAFTPDHVQADVDLFAGRTGQYVFISSASAYQTPPARLPIVESTPLRNPRWEYSRNKIACENLLVEAYRDNGFPATIVRPSHTYDRTAIPTTGNWTDLDRMRRGLPVVVHGDGTSLWALTHHVDFAKAFVGLLGKPAAVGDSFHITSDESLTWNQIYTALGTALGVEAKLVHVASDTIVAAEPSLEGALLGDKAHSVIFDNSKVRALVPDYVATIPFSAGAREIVEWYDAHPERQKVDDDLNATFDKLIAAAGQ